jgi:hypothetical protein
MCVLLRPPALDSAPFLIPRRAPDSPRIFPRAANNRARLASSPSQLLSGALPLVQAHAFIGVGVVVGVVAVLDAHKWLADPVLFSGWASAGVLALATGGPQMIMFRKTVSEGFYGSFMSFGWLFTKDLCVGARVRARSVGVGG